MYRMFCESYKNYRDSFYDSKDSYRYKIKECLSLISDIEEYRRHKMQDSTNYKKLCDLLYHMERQKDLYPRFKAFLWTIEYKGIKGEPYNILEESEIQELIKIVNMFLKMLYWN